MEKKTNIQFSRSLEGELGHQGRNVKLMCQVKRSHLP